MNMVMAAETWAHTTMQYDTFLITLWNLDFWWLHSQALVPSSGSYIIVWCLRGLYRYMNVPDSMADVIFWCLESSMDGQTNAPIAGLGDMG
jgi:hypothetical protein